MIAQEAGLPIIGLVGVLLLAKQRRLIPNVRKPLRQLTESGFFLDDAVQREILERVSKAVGRDEPPARPLTIQPIGAGEPAARPYP